MKKNEEKIQSLPSSLKVKVLQNKQSGVFIAELEDLQLFTEADSLDELDNNINDLVYTYFDIPKKLQSEIWYKRAEDNSVQPKQKISLAGLMRFQILLSPQANKYYRY